MYDGDKTTNNREIIKQTVMVVVHVVSIMTKHLIEKESVSLVPDEESSSTEKIIKDKKRH